DEVIASSRVPSGRVAWAAEVREVCTHTVAVAPAPSSPWRVRPVSRVPVRAPLSVAPGLQSRAPAIGAAAICTAAGRAGLLAGPGAMVSVYSAARLPVLVIVTVPASARFSAL